jgi:hypothetical protein
LLADGDYEEEDDDDNFENSDVEEDDDIDEDILVGAEDVALFRRGSGDSGGKKNRASILGRGDECQVFLQFHFFHIYFTTGLILI